MGAAEDVAADLGMGLHLAILGFGQATLLQENGIGHGDLADVVHRGCETDVVADLARQTELKRDRFRVSGDTQRVAGGFRILVAGGECQAMNNLLLAFAQFPHGTLHLAAQPFCLIGQLTTRAGEADDVLDARLEFDRFTGLVRKSIAPALRAAMRVVMSLSAVTKMTGTSAYFSKRTISV